MKEDLSGKALKSGVWYTIANFITKALVFLTTPFFTRLLSHEQFGDFNNFSSWLNVLMIVCTLNLESSFISARFEFEKIFDEYVLSMLALSSLSIGTCGLFINVFFSELENVFLLNRFQINIMLVYLVFITAVHMYQTKERYFFGYIKTVAISLAVTVSTAGLSAILVYYCKDRLFGRVVGHCLPTIIIGIRKPLKTMFLEVGVWGEAPHIALLLFVEKQKGRFLEVPIILYLFIALKGRRIDSRYWKYALPIALPYIPHLLSLSLLNSMDKIQITKICGSGDNALYSLAYTCGAVVSILLVSMNNAFSPWLGERLNQNETEKIRSFSKVYISIFCVGLIGLMLMAPEFLLIMGGKSYLQAKYVMPPIAFGCACQFIYTMFVNVEQFRKKTIGMAIGSVSAAIVNYVLNIILIPIWGYIAAAYTTLISFLWLLVVHMIIVKIIKEDKIYSYKFIGVIVCLLFVCTVLISWLYSYDRFRYIALGLYAIFIFIVCIKNKTRLDTMVKTIFLRR